MYADYLVLGLVAVFGVMAVFIGSMVIRYLNLRRSLEQLEALAEKERR
jgi:hypothetical protein